MRRGQPRLLRPGWAAILAASLLAAAVAPAEVFRWVDDNGDVHFGDRPSQAHRSEPVEIRVNTYEAVTYASHTGAPAESVVMYSASWCGVCKQARRYFEQQQIAFTEYDIEQDAKGRTAYRRLGASGVPVILVGDRRMNGFSVAGFEKLYGRQPRR